ncbi:MAG: type II toxin-antitoxin system VapC family toxin, partial [Planctomycetota bacterium]
DDDFALRVLDAAGRSLALAPTLWMFEVRNGILIARRRGRIDEVGLRRRVVDVDRLGVTIDDGADLDHAMDLAQAHGLTFYDALYLELALRRRAALATLDRKLIAAAGAEGVLFDG